LNWTLNAKTGPESVRMAAINRRLAADGEMARPGIEPGIPRFQAVAIALKVVQIVVAALIPVVAARARLQPWRERLAR
jgi:hypothetical protein